MVQRRPPIAAGDIRINSVIEDQPDTFGQRCVHENIIPPRIITCPFYVREAQTDDFRITMSGSPKHLFRQIHVGDR